MIPDCNECVTACYDSPTNSYDSIMGCFDSATTNRDHVQAAGEELKTFLRLAQGKCLMLLVCIWLTGTIGIMLSRGAKRVIGVEISQAAIEDSIVNAKLNGVDNIEFVCNKAHRLVRDLTSYTQGDDGDIVAVLNPGRPGVNSKVIQALRHNKSIRRIVYVSCKPYGNAAVNFIRYAIQNRDCHSYMYNND
ncbi:hypothetical protein FSP39_020224 [Pinctada imbricata]|uniref:tRNA (uracil(54)-C(5))-methyltransferase n=1 Tax=Pinctada imbricata TaxID=66713 RepID=A0AA88YTS7_PINIB|nr:hypothetical protein FSP39_020224 [Pinctada imbricata]